MDHKEKYKELFTKALIEQDWILRRDREHFWWKSPTIKVSGDTAYWFGIDADFTIPCSFKVFTRTEISKANPHGKETAHLFWFSPFGETAKAFRQMKKRYNQKAKQEKEKILLRILNKTKGTK